MGLRSIEETTKIMIIVFKGFSVLLYMPLPEWMVIGVLGLGLAVSC